MSTKKKISVSLAGASSDAIPESPELRRPARTEAPEPPRHVNGQAIPAAFAHVIGYESTDEGVAERLAKPHASASVGRGPLEKSFEHRRDFRMAEDDAEAAPDPMGDLTRRYVGEGMRGKFLGPMSIDQKGMRGYEPVKDERGEVVTLGRMILGEIPEETAVRRQQAAEDRGNRASAVVQEEFNEGQAKIDRDHGSRSSTRGSSRDPDDGLHESRGNDVDEVLR
jgi:hypothetical protein